MRIRILLILFLLSGLGLKAQSTLPVYSDYLSDNVYLIHPAAAGIGNCGKIRLTYRKQWSGVDNPPSLQTLSFHTRITEKMAVGLIGFNDENGYHAQKGLLGTYAYHLNFGREDALNQLSFGISFMYVQNSVDQTGFISTLPDPIVSGIVESSNYFNAEFGMGYHYMDFFSYFTIKNLLLTAQDPATSSYESLNLRRYLLTFGYYMGRAKKVQFEPSVMMQFVEYTREAFVDLNFKAYMNVGTKSQIWAVLSYRQNFDSHELESFKQITPIVGINYKRFMFSYTYSSQIGDVVIDGGGNHQLTVGFNVFCNKQRATGCPNVNSFY